MVDTISKDAEDIGEENGKLRFRSNSMKDRRYDKIVKTVTGSRHTWKLFANIFEKHVCVGFNLELVLRSWLRIHMLAPYKIHNSRTF